MRICISLKFVIQLTLVAMLVTGCDRVKEEYYEGRSRGAIDVRSGQLKIAFVDGVKMTNFWEYTQLLQKRYAIGWLVYSLPANPRAAEAWVRGYNEVATADIYRRFGTNVLDQTLADAQ